MRVLYDGIVFENSYQHGVQRVIRELIERLPPEIEPVLTLSTTPKCPLPDGATVRRTAPPLPRFLPRSLRRAVRDRVIPSAMRRLAEDSHIFHSTYFTLPPADIPTVVHVYDLIPEQFPECFAPGWAEPEIARRASAMRAATRLVAISHATATDIARFYPELAAKTRVVQLGCEHLARPLANNQSRGDYALFVGDRKGYKNFSIILDAMESAAWPRGLALTVVGSPWRDEELDRINGIASSRTIHHAGRISDSELAGLYASARCVISPSLGEGFGLPLLEAHALGAPLVCSDIPASREVAGTAGLFFDPQQAENLIACITDALEPATRDRLLAAGRDNLTRFSWDRHVKEISDIYRTIAP